MPRGVAGMSPMLMGGGGMRGGNMGGGLGGMGSPMLMGGGGGMRGGNMGGGMGGMGSPMLMGGSPMMSGGRSQGMGGRLGHGRKFPGPSLLDEAETGKAKKSSRLTLPYTCHLVSLALVQVSNAGCLRVLCVRVAALKPANTFSACHAYPCGIFFPHRAFWLGVLGKSPCGRPARHCCRAHWKDTGDVEARLFRAKSCAGPGATQCHHTGYHRFYWRWIHNQGPTGGGLH